jgi:hypothetical protein
MEEARLDKELERIYKKFVFLWENHNFRARYITRSFGFYDRGFIIGLENDICKLIFMKETNSPSDSIIQRVGKKPALFRPPGDSHLSSEGWYPLPGLVYWLSGVECERDKNVDQDLENVSQYLRLHIDKLLDLFKFPDDFDRKLEYHRNLYKENQITVENIREERARLQALGQDSSLEAAIANLRGGRK